MVYILALKGRSRLLVQMKLIFLQSNLSERSLSFERMLKLYLLALQRLMVQHFLNISPIV